jgi:hypothetical protein
VRYCQKHSKLKAGLRVVDLVPYSPEYSPLDIVRFASKIKKNIPRWKSKGDINIKVVAAVLAAGHMFTDAGIDAVGAPPFFWTLEYEGELRERLTRTVETQTQIFSHRFTSISCQSFLGIREKDVGPAIEAFIATIRRCVSVAAFAVLSARERIKDAAGSAAGSKSGSASARTKGSAPARAKGSASARAVASALLADPEAFYVDVTHPGMPYRGYGMHLAQCIYSYGGFADGVFGCADGIFPSDITTMLFHSNQGGTCAGLAALSGDEQKVLDGSKELQRLRLLSVSDVVAKKWSSVGPRVKDPFTKLGLNARAGCLGTQCCEWKKAFLFLTPWAEQLFDLCQC